ncbi:MAG TPA: sigma-54 dependent transcriptional regulator [Pyrinomonadaceae bacterium]
MQALVIDDEPQVRAFVCALLQEEGWNTAEADSAERAFDMLHDRDWAVVFCDVHLGGENGFSVLRRFKEELPDTRVVLMTGRASALGALDATAFGAYDYLLKPFGVEELQSISQAMRDRLAHLPRRRLVSHESAPGAYDSDLELVGRSAAFIEVMKQVGRVAMTNLPVLLTGETGTGKELVAAALHRRSERAKKPFVAVNCGAIPTELIESELFGHTKGAFTGADRDRRGLWEEADGGSIFLDEITETTSAFQVKLLRALEAGEIRRVGTNQVLHVNVRVIASSNLDVEQEVKAGRFREDLFYRLNAVSIVLPPLRERREDIFPLAKSFVERAFSLSPAVTFSKEALDLLERYPWPGNIRELENAVVRAAALCDSMIRPQDLPDRVLTYQEDSAPETSPAVPEGPSLTNGPWVPLAEVERHYVARVLAHTGGNKQAAARLLGVDRKTLQRMIVRHGLTV